MQRKKLILITFPIIVLMGIYFLGPEPAKAKFTLAMPAVPQSPDELEKYIAMQEGKHKIKPDNEARIIWGDSTKKKTEYSVVYLHGFYSSQGEGDPVHADFARKFGCNLYLARLADHGIDTVDQLIGFTVDKGWESAKEALAIGKSLGEKVILMSTSTGGTLALELAAEYPQDVFALINMSPNIRINHPLAFIANDPWGLQIARLVRGGKFEVSQSDSLHDRYWYQKFRLEAVVQLQEFLEEKMNSDTFKKIKCPSLTMYYYKNEKEQDPTVKVSAMLEMNKDLGTPDDLKETVAIPNAGGHVLGSYASSKDIPAVEAASEKFAVEKLKMVKK